MAQKKKKLKYIIVFLVFVIYFFIAARPLPRETVLAPQWISSMPGGITERAIIDGGGSGDFMFHTFSDKPLPFSLGNYFGYIDSSGQFILNQIRTDDIYISHNLWSEYEAQPGNIIVNNIEANAQITVENARGYPVLLDNRIFILGSEQNSLSEIGNDGNVLWTYDFGAPITCIDVAAGFVVTGSLDGAIEVFDSTGDRIFFFEPGGSRYSVILGCAISLDGSKIAVVSGIDQQRFLLLERFGTAVGDYRITHHEFLGAGFRRPVRVLFVDEDQHVVFERAGGIGCYNIRSRRGILIPLYGDIAAIDDSGDQGFFFVITYAPNRMLAEKRLIGIRLLPDRLFGLSVTSAQNAVFLDAPFKSEDVFLGRMNGSMGPMLVTGGGSTLISFKLEER